MSSFTPRWQLATLGVLGTLIATAGCVQRQTVAPPADATPPQPGIALILQGSAFSDDAARERVRQAISATSGRSARLVVGDPSIEDVLRPEAERIARESHRPLAREWRNARCRKKLSALAPALVGDADVVYRVEVDAKTASRPATGADRATLLQAEGYRRMLAALGLDRRNTVFETQVDGVIERTSFGGAPETRRRDLGQTQRILGVAGAPPPIDSADLVASVVRSFDAPPPARWEPIARALVGGGCPITGSAVAEAFVTDPATKRRLHSAAVASLSGNATRRKEPPQPAEPAAPPENAPEPDAAAEPPTPTQSEVPPSCSMLCELHVIELCNNDRALWSRHGSRWEKARCGVRRSESFLEECYRLQWLSGTYELACLRPCEGTSEGRDRLVALLRRAGCLRVSG